MQNWLQPKKERPLGQMNILDTAMYLSNKQTNKQIKNIADRLNGREKAIDFPSACRVF